MVDNRLPFHLTKNTLCVTDRQFFGNGKFLPANVPLFQKRRFHRGFDFVAKLSNKKDTKSTWHSYKIVFGAYCILFLPAGGCIKGRDSTGIIAVNQVISSKFSYTDRHSKLLPVIN